MSVEKMVGLGLLMAILFGSNLVNAGDDQYCSLMYAIYGCCSPELVHNYLVKISEPVKPRESISSSKLNLTISTLGIPEAQKQFENFTYPEKPSFRYTWYWTNDRGWVRGRFVG